MPIVNHGFRPLLVPILFGVSLCSCGQQGTHRDNIAAEDMADAQAKGEELKLAEGNYAGTMLLARSHQTFDVAFQLWVAPENVHSTSSVDPTETAEVPKLGGDMRFPAVERLTGIDFADFAELLEPMGGITSVNFTFGDYNPKTHRILIPYTVPGYASGNFGQLSGVLERRADGDHFRGQWSAIPFGIVGTFDVLRSAIGSSGGGAQ